MNAAIEGDRFVCTPHQELLDLLEVIGKGTRARASDRLIEFRPRQNSGRPSDRSIEGNPFDECALKHTCRIARPQLARHHEERVAQMTDHLLNGHDAPSARGILVQGLQPR